MKVFFLVQRTLCMECLNICIQLKLTKYNEASIDLDFHSHTLLEWLMPVFLTKKGHPVETQGLRWALWMSRRIILSPRFLRSFFFARSTLCGRVKGKALKSCAYMGNWVFRGSLCEAKHFSETYHIIWWKNMISHYFMWRSPRQGQRTECRWWVTPCLKSTGALLSAKISDSGPRPSSEYVAPGCHVQGCLQQQALWAAIGDKEVPNFIV